MDLRRALATKVIDPLVWRAKRMPVGAQLERFRAEQWDDAETVGQRQAERLRGLLTHAVTRVPFYRERVAGLTPADGIEQHHGPERENERDQPQGQKSGAHDSHRYG